MARKAEIRKLSIARLQHASRWLAKQDAALKRVIEEHGYPALWNRTPGFSTMVHIILEQQVSLASANATFYRLESRLSGSVTAAKFLELQDADLQAIGFTRQKIRYTRLLAEEVVSGRFDFEALDPMTDEMVREELTKHKGIGNWTADIYLSECLLRCDILPKGDIGVQEAYRLLMGLDKRPTDEQLIAMTQHWRPWRSVATRILWLFYMNRSREKRLRTEGHVPPA